MATIGKAIRSIFIPSDFSEASERALAHALAMAVVWKCELCLLHAGGDAFSDEEWENAPSVRRMLAEWGFLEPNATRRAIYDELNVSVRKVESRGRPPLDATLEFLRKSPSDLVVLATGARRGLLRMMHRSVAEAIGRHVSVPTLFVPSGAPGFIARDGGTSSLRRVTMAVRAGDDTEPLLRTARLLEPLGAGQGAEVELLRIGDDAPEVVPPHLARVRWRVRRASDARPLRALFESEPDLVVLTAHEASDEAERVVRRGACPVLCLRPSRE